MEPTRPGSGRDAASTEPRDAEPGHDRRDASEQARLDAFAGALDALRARMEREVDDRDVRKMQRVRRLSTRLEVTGRGLIWGSFEPLTFCAGTAALCVHKILELMPIGHTVLHGTFDRREDAEGLRSNGFAWKAPIDEASWCHVHNLRHHQYTNIAGRDPDLDFGGLRLAEGVPHRSKRSAKRTGVQHRSAAWPRRLREVLRTLRALARAPSPASVR